MGAPIDTEVIPRYRKQKHGVLSLHHDYGDPEGNKLLGKGKRIPWSESRGVSGLKELVQDFPTRHGINQKEVEIWEHTSAEVANDLGKEIDFQWEREEQALVFRDNQQRR